MSDKRVEEAAQYVERMSQALFEHGLELDIGEVDFEEKDDSIVATILNHRGDKLALGGMKLQSGVIVAHCNVYDGASKSDACLCISRETGSTVWSFGFYGNSNPSPALRKLATDCGLHPEHGVHDSDVEIDDQRALKTFGEIARFLMS